MKTIGIIRKLAAMAELRACNSGNHGEATQNRRYIDGYDAGEQTEVYRVEYTKTDMSGDTAKLYHHGTKTAELWKSAEGWNVISIYGESRSDADSVNTFLAWFNVTERYTFKPANGGFQQV